MPSLSLRWRRHPLEFPQSPTSSPPTPTRASVSEMPMFGKMVDRDVFSRNVMVGGYGENGFLDDALDLYQRMLWAGNDIRPDIYTFPCALRSCSGVLDLMRKREIHAHVIRFGFGLETDVLNSPILMCRKCGEVPCARKVFDEMLMKDCSLRNGMIFGYLENEERFEELISFLTMHDISFEPELLTTRSVICASGSVCDKRLAKEIHGYVVKKRFDVDVSVSNSLIRMYSSFGSLNEAEKTLPRVETKDVVSSTAMISRYEKNVRGCLDQKHES